MRASLQIDFPGEFYDAGEVRKAVRQVGRLASVDVRTEGSGTIVTIQGERDEIGMIAGAIMNIALAGTMGVRS